MKFDKAAREGLAVGFVWFGIIALLFIVLYSCGKGNR